MKPNYLTILITTLCIFFNACHNSNTAPQLQLADSLIDKRADSALCILEKLSIEEISNKSAKAMYALLLTEALDKNFKSHRNDSLILIAVDYYKDNSNNKLKTKAYYYLGRVYQDNKEYIKATEAYLTALKTASPNQAPILQIYNNLALCYESQEFYLPAIKIYKESYATAEKMQDKYGILHATRGLGNVYAIQDEEEKALSYATIYFIVPTIVYNDWLDFNGGCVKTLAQPLLYFTVLLYFLLAMLLFPHAFGNKLLYSNYIGL